MRARPPSASFCSTLRRVSMISSSAFRQTPYSIPIDSIPMVTGRPDPLFCDSGPARFFARFDGSKPLPRGLSIGAVEQDPFQSKLRGIFLAQHTFCRSQIYARLVGRLIEGEGLCPQRFRLL